MRQLAAALKYNSSSFKGSSLRQGVALNFCHDMAVFISQVFNIRDKRLPLIAVRLAWQLSECGPADAAFHARSCRARGDYNKRNTMCYETSLKTAWKMPS
jgi:hypothetical protein